jgi:predicted DNA-binding protein YlxM (UPF0122 family)
MSFQRRRFTREELEQARQASELRRLKAKLLSNYVERDGGYATPCWEWLGSWGGSNGYGSVWWKGRNHRAHRLLWQCHYGEIPEDIFICHHCDNPWCIRLEHLFADTAESNTADMIAKGRDAFSWMNRGELSGHTHLTNEQVLEIRRKCAAGMTHDEIAEQYQIERQAVSNINSGKTWAHLLPDDYMPAPKSYAIGEQAGPAKLTEDQARQIRKLALIGAYSQREIGEMFGVSKTAVGWIKRGRNWRHLWQADDLPHSINAASSTANVE